MSRLLLLELPPQLRDLLVTRRRLLGRFRRLGRRLLGRARRRAAPARLLLLQLLQLRPQGVALSRRRVARLACLPRPAALRLELGAATPAKRLELLPCLLRLRRQLAQRRQLRLERAHARLRPLRRGVRRRLAVLRLPAAVDRLGRRHRLRLGRARRRRQPPVGLLRLLELAGLLAQQVVRRGQLLPGRVELRLQRGLLRHLGGQLGLLALQRLDRLLVVRARRHLPAQRLDLRVILLADRVQPVVVALDGRQLLGALL